MTGPMEYTEQSLVSKQIQKMLDTLPERTQIIMKMRYGVGGPKDPVSWRKEHTLEEVGAYLKITRERVRQIEKETLIKLKNEFMGQF
jgi:RNA polymerase primary sigma factor